MGTSGSQGKASIPRSTDRVWRPKYTFSSRKDHFSLSSCLLFLHHNWGTCLQSYKKSKVWSFHTAFEPCCLCSLFLRLNTQLMTTMLCLQWHRQSLLNAAVLLPVQAKQSISLLPLVGNNISYGTILLLQIFYCSPHKAAGFSAMFLRVVPAYP